MASYNGSLYIRDQIQSILPQLAKDDELIISDDSSTDDTEGVVRSINDPRIRFLGKNTFRNPTENFGNALRHAKGDIIFLCDQDDVWLPEKVSVMVETLGKYDFATSDCTLVNEKLEMISPSFIQQVEGRTGLIRNLFLKTSPYIGACMAFRKEVLKKAMPIPPGMLHHDYWIAMVAEMFFKTIIINKSLVLYRRHGSNVTNTGGKSSFTTLQKIGKRLHVVSNLFKRIIA
jgi:glycosyltransferase involved in cell wall biosynthesis